MRCMAAVAILAFVGPALPVLLSPAAHAQDKQDPVREQYAAKLNTLRVSVDFKDAPLEDVVAFLRDFSEMNFLVDKTAKEKGDIKITIKVEELPLKNVLNLMLQPQGLACVYKDGVLLIMAEGQEEVKMEIYDVRDVLFPIQQFPGADIALSEGEAELLQPPVSEEEALPVVDLVKAHTGGRSWEEDARTTINLENGLLVVKQTRAVHAEIRRMIQRLRDFK